MGPSTTILAALIVAAVPVHAQIAGRWEPPGEAASPERTPRAETFTALHARLGWRDFLGADAQEALRREAARGWSLHRSTRDGDTVEHGTLVLAPGAGDLRAVRLPADFELDLSYALAEGGNSGVKYRVPLEGDDRRGPEYQLLDDRAFPDLDTRHRCGALYDVVAQLAAVEHVTRDGFVHHTGRVRAVGPRLHHETDGVPTARALVGSERWTAALAASKFADVAERFGVAAPGWLLLQDHGSPVRFTHLFVRELDALPGERLELFDGATLDGWRLVGDASYAPTADGIRGTITTGARNAFLVTERTFGDFVLELEVRLEDDGNSGVQVRSAIDGERLVGYQVEIDPSERAWSGGLYDEGRRGWLQDLSANAAGRAAFLRDGWNRYRIECVGPWIRTWVNDVPVVDRLDALDLEGHVGLQVHSGTNTRLVWRDLVLHDLGRHVWRPAPQGFWTDGSLAKDGRGLAWSDEDLADGGWRVRFLAPPEDLRVLVAVGDPRRVLDPVVTAREFAGEDETTWGANGLGVHTSAGGLVVKLADVPDALARPVPGHELELDVLRYGNRLTVSFGGRVLFASHDVRGVRSSGRLGLWGVDLDSIAATEVLAPK